MPYRICKSFEVESGHMLAKHPEKCRFPHGHTRKVEFVLEADTLDANDMVCDFKLVKELVGAFLDTYDHALCMNTDDPKYADMKAAYSERVIGFDKTDPTTEVMAETIFRYCQEQLAARVATQQERYPIRTSVRLVTVRVWETSSSWAEYFE
ncbi:6-pyruvoyl trahydropterin synthase family protein [Verrucomicrobiota bacterium sgz303538]